MGKLFGSDAALQYAWVSLRARIARVRSGEMERGASAVEWVVISMIVVTIVATSATSSLRPCKRRRRQGQNCIAGADGSKNGC